MRVGSISTPRKQPPAMVTATYSASSIEWRARATFSPTSAPGGRGLGDGSDRTAQHHLHRLGVQVFLEDLELAARARAQAGRVDLDGVVALGADLFGAHAGLHQQGVELRVQDRAVAHVFGPRGVPCSSIKGWTGHTLGAAGGWMATVLACATKLMTTPWHA